MIKILIIALVGVKENSSRVAYLDDQNTKLSRA
jgi:hypothetical protein